MSVDIISLLLDIKQDLGVLTSETSALKDKLELHSQQSKATAEKVSALEKDAWKAKGAIAVVLVLGTVMATARMLFN